MSGAGRFHDPVSTWTAAAYPLVGVLLLLHPGGAEAAVLALALLALGVGTALFHARRDKPSQDADHAGMNASYVALATLAAGGPWWAMLLAAAAAAVVVEYVMDHPNRVLMGVTAWITLVALGAAGAYVAQLLGLLLFAVGYALWHLDEDLAHGLGWHVLTAAGTYVWAGGLL